MIITTLVENTSISNDLACEHGLSLYIQTTQYKILFDLGQSDLFFINAKKQNINLEDIDFVIISHGHYDHGGGIAHFMTINSKAKIFVNNKAFDNHFAMDNCSNDSDLKYIGLDSSILPNNRIIFTHNNYAIDDNITLFGNINNIEPKPSSNTYLLMQDGDNIVKDTFVHEQNLVIEENGKIVLFVGCAHNGVVNIVEHFYKTWGIMPHYVIGGFHLWSKRCGNESNDVIDKISGYLKDTNAIYYTGHCTGQDPYERIKIKLGNKINYIHTGSKIIIE